jgi:hypothetical protein
MGCIVLLHLSSTPVDQLTACTQKDWTDIDLSLELLVRFDRVGSDQDLSSSDLLSLDTSQQGTHVITGLSTVKLLVEHL